MCLCISRYFLKLEIYFNHFKYVCPSCFLTYPIDLYINATPFCMIYLHLSVHTLNYVVIRCAYMSNNEDM